MGFGRRRSRSAKSANSSVEAAPDRRGSARREQRRISRAERTGRLRRLRAKWGGGGAKERKGPLLRRGPTQNTGAKGTPGGRLRDFGGPPGSGHKQSSVC